METTAQKEINQRKCRSEESQLDHPYSPDRPFRKPKACRVQQIDQRLLVFPDLLVEQLALQQFRTNVEKDTRIAMRNSFIARRKQEKRNHQYNPQAQKRAEIDEFALAEHVSLQNRNSLSCNGVNSVVSRWCPEFVLTPFEA